VFNGDTAYIIQLKRQKSKRCLLLLQHVAIMSTCSYVIAPFLIFAVLVVCLRVSAGLLTVLHFIWFNYRRVQRLRLLIKGLKFWRFDNTISEFWAYFHCACAEMPSYELLVKNLTSPFASATQISCIRWITLLSEYISLCFGDFFSAHAQIWRQFCFRCKNCPHRPVQRPRFLMKGLKLWRFDNTISEFWAYFTAHAQKQLFRNFRSKIWSHSLRRHRFPIRQMHFHYRVTFTGYIRCFCATMSHDHFDLDLLTLKVFCVQRFSCPTHIPIFIILRLLLTELRVLNIWSHHISVVWSSHCACAVSR